VYRKTVCRRMESSRTLRLRTQYTKVCASMRQAVYLVTPESHRKVREILWPFQHHAARSCTENVSHEFQIYPGKWAPNGYFSCL